MSKPPRIVLGQIVLLASGPFRVVSYSKGCFLLRDEHSGADVVMHHFELARQLPPGQALQTAPAAEVPVSKTLDVLTEQDRLLATHLQQLLDDENPAIGRIAAKVDELKQLGLSMSEATLKRRLRRYREAGLAGLVDRRTTKEKAPLSRTDETVLEIVGELLDGYKGKSSVTYTSVRADLKKELRLRFPDASKRPQHPSLSNVMRMVKRLAGDQDPTRAAARRETDALVPKRAFRPRGVTAPGDECQADTTIFDAFVRMPDGSIARPYLTILLDRKTRSIISHAFTAGPPTGYDHALLLANALVPRRSRKWNGLYTSMGFDEMPWAKYLTDEQRSDFDTHRPYILPRRILIDNGQDYRSLVFRAACERYGIGITEAPPHSPTTKSHVERNFATINTKFTQFLPGYAGGSTQNRGVKIDEKDVLHLHELDELFDRWVAIVWQNREHAGLRDNDNPSVRHTPNTMFMAAVALTGHFHVPVSQEDFFALMPSERRTVQNDGISFRSRTYDSPHLLPFRRSRNGDGTPKTVEMHFDPTDRHQVWVRTEEGTWITCHWTALPQMQRPLDTELMRRAADFTRRSTTITDDAADDLLLDLRDTVVGETREREQAEREAQRTLRRAEQRAAKRQQRKAAHEDDGDDHELAVA